MRNTCRGACLLAVVAVLAQSAEAQVMYAPFNVTFRDTLTLLKYPEVRRELKLGEKEAARVDAALQAMDKRYREGLRGLAKLPRAEASRSFGAMKQKIAAEPASTLKGILTPAQRKRYEQIAFQRRVPDGFEEPEVQKKLKLTDGQKKRVKALADERRALFARETVSEEELQKWLADQTDKTLAVFDAGQKRAWRELTGEAFEVKPGWLLRIVDKHEK